MFLMIKKYLKKRSGSLRTLTIVTFFLATAVILDPVLFTAYRIAGLNGSTFEFAVDVQTHLSFGCAGISNLFLVVFIVNVFLDGKYPWYSYVFMILELSILPLGLILLFTGQDTLPVLLIFLVTSITIYIMQILVTGRLRRKLETGDDRVAYQAILHLEASAFFLIATFIMFILQEVAVQTPEFASAGLVQGENSIFPTIGWILAVITAYYLFVGYLLPDWIKRRWEKNARKGPAKLQEEREYH